jgi:hypothetical protein
MAKVAARYAGEYQIVLAKFGGPYFDAEGSRLSSLLLSTGDTLQVEEEEIIGCTWLHDPRHEIDSVKLGLGRIVKPEDQDLSDAELNAKGYEFHQPSGLWAYADTPTTSLPEKKSATQDVASAPLPEKKSVTQDVAPTPSTKEDNS